MAGGAAAWLPGSSENRVAAIRRDIDQRSDLFNPRRRHHLAIDAVEAIGVHAPFDIAHVLQVVT